MISRKSRKDYCGPYWAPSTLRRLASSKFNASCKIHDMDYESKKFTRKEADLRFKDHLLRQSGNNILYRAISYLYYYMVRLGGRFSYGKSDK